MNYYIRRRAPWWQAQSPAARRGAWPRGWRNLETDGHNQPRTWAPATDMLDKGDHFVLRVELPGIPQEQIDLTLEKDVLTIRGKRPADGNAGDDEWLCCERPTGHFHRAIQLPAAVNAGDVEADYRDGLLTITLPKLAEAQSRRIKVTGA